ncbi:hypothetical protein VKT23_016178 [Stygiomarasmius scandens]|uniref:Protein kinase domain-containing protein n=1 Tax=Marasmiellus scandens TaxID=2682957 RepID=A0ABR1IZT1_9AGAR
MRQRKEKDGVRVHVEEVGSGPEDEQDQVVQQVSVEAEAPPSPSPARSGSASGYDSERTLDLDDLGLNLQVYGAPLERMVGFDYIGSGWNSDEGTEGEEEVEDKADLLEALQKACQEARFQHVDSDYEEESVDSEYGWDSDSDSDITSVGYDELDFEGLIDELESPTLFRPNSYSTVSLPPPYPPLTLLPLSSSSSTLLLLLALNDSSLRVDPWNPIPRILCAVDKSLDTDAAQAGETIFLFLKHLVPFEPFVSSPSTSISSEAPLAIVNSPQTLSQWIDFCRQILEGLVFLHENGVVHGGFGDGDEYEGKTESRMQIPLFMMDISSDPEAVEVFFADDLSSTSCPSPVGTGLGAKAVPARLLPCTAGLPSKTTRKSGLTFNRATYPVKYYFTNLEKAVKVQDIHSYSAQRRTGSPSSFRSSSPSSSPSYSPAEKSSSHQNEGVYTSALTDSPISETRGLGLGLPPKQKLGPSLGLIRSQSSSFVASSPSSKSMSSLPGMTRSKSQQGATRQRIASSPLSFTALENANAAAASPPSSASHDKDKPRDRRRTKLLTKLGHPLFLADVQALGALFERKVFPFVKSLESASGAGDKETAVEDEEEGKSAGKEGERERRETVTSGTLAAESKDLEELRRSLTAPSQFPTTSTTAPPTITSLLTTLVQHMKSGTLTSEESRVFWEEGVWETLRQGGIKAELESEVESKFIEKEESVSVSTSDGGNALSRHVEDMQGEQKAVEEDQVRDERRPSIVIDLTEDLDEAPSPPPVPLSPSRRGSVQDELEDLVRKVEDEEDETKETDGATKEMEMEKRDGKQKQVGLGRPPVGSRSGPPPPSSLTSYRMQVRAPGPMRRTTSNPTTVQALLQQRQGSSTIPLSQYLSSQNQLTSVSYHRHQHGQHVHHGHHHQRRPPPPNSTPRTGHTPSGSWDSEDPNNTPIKLQLVGSDAEGNAIVGESGASPLSSTGFGGQKEKSKETQRLRPRNHHRRRTTSALSSFVPASASTSVSSGFVAGFRPVEDDGHVPKNEHRMGYAGRQMK